MDNELTAQFVIQERWLPAYSKDEADNDFRIIRIGARNLKIHCYSAN